MSLVERPWHSQKEKEKKMRGTKSCSKGTEKINGKCLSKEAVSYGEDIISRIEVGRVKEATRLFDNYIDFYAKKDTTRAMNELWTYLKSRGISSYDERRLMENLHRLHQEKRGR